jgi:hypothetical protein
MSVHNGIYLVTRWLLSPFAVTVAELTKERGNARSSYLVRAALDAAIYGDAKAARHWVAEYHKVESNSEHH